MATIPTPHDTPEAALSNPAASFQDTDADIILRSGDGHEFKTYKLLLSLSSPVFRDMFSLASQGDSGRIQTVDVTEDGDTLAALLSFCQPRSGQIPVPNTLTCDTTYQALLALEKYQMPSVIPMLLDQLMPRITISPLTIYATACHAIRLHEAAGVSVARAAAVELLKEDTPTSISLGTRMALEFRVPAMRALPAPYILSLFHFHHNCGNAVVQLITSPSIWCSAVKLVTKYESRYVFHWLESSQYCANCDYMGEGISVRRMADQSECISPDWWWDVLDALGPKLRATPCKSVLDDHFTGTMVSGKLKPKGLMKFHNGLNAFKRELGRQIDLTISKIPLELDL